MSQQPLIGLKLESQQVKWVEVRRAGGRLLLQRAEHAPALTALLTPTTAATRCIAALPRDEAFSRVLTLPTTDNTELRPMVELQAKSFLPYGQTDVILDYVILRRAAAQTTVLLLGVSRALVEQHLVALQHAGISQPEITLTTSGLLAWYHAARPQLAVSGTIILLELDAVTAECLIVTNGTLRLSRSIPIGTPPAWFEELDRTLENYRTEQLGEFPTHIILTGDPALVVASQTPLQEWTKLPVQSVDQWAVVTRASDLIVPTSGAWSSTLGLVVSPGAQPLITLLPPDTRRRRTQRVAQRAYLLTASLAIAVCGAATGFFWLDLRQQRYVQEQLDAALKQLAPQAKQLTHHVQRMTRLHQILGDRGQSLRALQELYRLTPQEITVTQFLVEPTQEVRIRGIGPTLSHLLTYVSALEHSPHLRDVHLRYSTERAAQTGTQVEFELVCQLEGVAPTVARRVTR